MLKKKLLVYTFIFACFVFTTNTFASSIKITNNGSPQIDKPQTNAKEVTLLLDKITEIPQGIITSSPTSNLSVTSDGKIAFLSEVKGGYIYSYDLDKGAALSSLVVGKKAENISLFENGEKRLLAVIDSSSTPNEATTVSVLDVSDAKKIKLLSAFILPPGSSLSASIKPVFDSTASRIFIASKKNPSLFAFETSTGRMLEQIPLNIDINNLTLVNQDGNSILVATNLSESKVLLFNATSKLELKNIFSLPESNSLIAQNNICFNKTGKVAYIASAKSNKLFSFDTLTGTLIDSYDVGDAPAQIALISKENKTLVAVVNTGKNHGFLANSISILGANNEGRFSGATVFLPPLGANLVADSPIKFNEKGTLAFVGTRNQSFFVFDPKTGEQLAETKVLGSATKFVLAKNKIVLLTNDESSKHLLVINTKVSKLEPIESTTDLNAIPKISKETIKEENIKLAPTNSVKINQVKVFRQRNIMKIRLIGKGFTPNSQILINERPIKTSYLRSTKLLAKFPIKLLSGRCIFDVVVKNSENENSLIFKRDLKCGK